MRMRFFGIVLLFFCLKLNAFAQQSDFGLGVVVGEPTAITAKKRLSSQRALDFGFGYYWQNSALFFGDYLFQFPGTFQTDNSIVNTFVPYVGLGSSLNIYKKENRKRIGDNEANLVLSARIPIGVSWAIANSPIEVFVEIVPVLNIIPGLSFDMNAGLGGRIFF